MTGPDTETTHTAQCLHCGMTWYGADGGREAVKHAAATRHTVIEDVKRRTIYNPMLVAGVR